MPNISNRVYYIGGLYMGCHYYRCHLPALANGNLTNYLSLEKSSLKSPQIVRDELMASDTVVFHRPNTNWHHRVAMELKKAGKTVIFDNDDTFIMDKSHAFYGLDEKGFEQNTERINNVINNFIINADAVTCSTETLKKEYLKLNPNVHVLPNMVNPEDWDTPLRNDKPNWFDKVEKLECLEAEKDGKKISFSYEKVRIGVVGSTAYYHDFRLIEKELEILSKDERIQLVMFGLQSKDSRKANKRTEKVHRREYGFWDNINVERVPWCSMSDYFTQLNDLRLDIMIIPRFDSYFNKCKSNVKFLEASMCEIPVVTNHFDGCPYEKDGEYLVWANDWLKDLEPLITNKELRRSIGKKAKEYVIKNYNIWDKGHLWEDVYKKYEEN